MRCTSGRRRGRRRGGAAEYGGHRLERGAPHHGHPPFMGQLTASHPAKALEEGYENRIVAQAREAGARLPE